MNKRLRQQFFGFVSTPALWKDRDMFDLEQWNFPEVVLPSNLNIAAEIPSIKTNYVLGKRMERFFELSVKHSPAYHLIISNLQIVHHGETQGELDFVIENKYLKKKIHIELIYKFYVYDPAEKNELARWKGPNRNDSLLRKIHKLQEQQFPLLYKERTKEMLATYSLDAQMLEQQVCFKALLFVPKKSGLILSDGINQQCVAGYYLNLKEFKASDHNLCHYYAPAKQDWPIDPQSNQEWLSYSKILEHIVEQHAKRRSPLVWLKRKNQTQRFFVVWW